MSEQPKAFGEGDGERIEKYDMTNSCGKPPNRKSST